jgi:hypothetical protein
VFDDAASEAEAESNTATWLTCTNERASEEIGTESDRARTSVAARTSTSEAAAESAGARTPTKKRATSSAADAESVTKMKRVLIEVTSSKEIEAESDKKRMQTTVRVIESEA